jgi:hypothetical protein
MKTLFFRTLGKLETTMEPRYHNNNAYVAYTRDHLKACSRRRPQRLNLPSHLMAEYLARYVAYTRCHSVSVSEKRS